MKSVVICGSRRFKKEIREFESKLVKAGVVVFSPHLTSFDWSKFPKKASELMALGLTHDHFYKIKMADVVFVYNKDGYSGVSTTLEIGYAVALGKPIYALSDKDEELCRLTLFREIVKTPKELVNKLK